ncbi:PREDICTED: sperm-tail PG-rich repeat-containing protein 2 [Miniopterus natalensis]|uniref:sperm-tail PG-rich repeat-containing protein 2 n=1 Tax=Miniopterus natalensis TaxID=291302 RepID=UPI0007A70FAE|nr:PREDICTED: sperm-tail PG-rich repeat-containing protein 2 [Miniopterus natalensis]
MYDRAPRVLRYAEGGSTEDHVGPGSYQVPFPKQQATGGYAPFLSLVTRESTFTVASNTEEAVPGPGRYNISEKQKTSRSPAVFRIAVPSIPSYGQSYGYHINDDDSIRKHSPPANDSTLGPAYYKPQFDFSSATLKYKGIHFGKSLGRLQLPIKSGPGPGQYDIAQKKTTHYENINIKKDQPKNYCLHLPRYYEVIILQEEKKRFAPMKSTIPAPGTYNESRTAFKPLKKKPTSKETPFGQSAARFQEDSKTEEMPGPGFYNILNNTVIDNSSKACLKKQRKSAFGSSVPRTFFLHQKEAFTTPGPAAYQDISVPGCCGVQNLYEMSQVQRRYFPPCSSVDKIKHTTFLSTTLRCLYKITEGPDK